MSVRSDERLMRYLDGEASESEAREVEQWLEESREARALARDLEAVGAAVRAIADEKGAGGDSIADAVMKRLELPAAPRSLEEQRSSKKSPRRGATSNPAPEAPLQAGGLARAPEAPLQAGGLARAPQATLQTGGLARTREGGQRPPETSSREGGSSPPQTKWLLVPAIGLSLAAAAAVAVVLLLKSPAADTRGPVAGTPVDPSASSGSESAEIAVIADDATGASIESVDFGAQNGTIFMVPSGPQVTPVVWLDDGEASEG